MSRPHKAASYTGTNLQFWFSAWGGHLIDTAKEVAVGPFSGEELLLGCGFAVAKYPSRLDFDGFETVPNLPLGELEDLPRSPVPECHIAEGESLFCGSSTLPEFAQAIGEDLGGDTRLLLAAEGVDGFPFARLVDPTLADLLDELKLNEWAVQVVLLDVTFAASGRNVRVEKGLEVLLKVNVRKIPLLFFGFLFEGAKSRASAELRLLPAI
jgi:hypothetical protein